jgi:hypothetical protein
MTPVIHSERNKSYRKSYRAREALRYAEALKQIRLLCPLKEIRIPRGIGETNTDYGKKGSSLNFPPDILANPKKAREQHFGSFTIGLEYSADHKKQTHKGRHFCIRSEKYMPWLLIIKYTLSCRTLYPHPIETLRVNAIRGANTQWHTDTLRGTTDNCILIFSDASQENMNVGKKADCRGYLSVDKSIHFRACTVLFQVGHLPYAIMGVKQGKLQTVPFGHNTKKEFLVIPTPKKLILWSWAETLDAAQETTYPLAPPILKKGRYVHLGKENRWQLFNAWCFRHRWEGNTSPVRLHAYCRAIRQVCPSGHLRRYANGYPMNFVDHTKK